MLRGRREGEGTQVILFGPVLGLDEGDVVPLKKIFFHPFKIKSGKPKKTINGVPLAS